MLIVCLVAVGVAIAPRRWWEALALGAPVLLPWWMSLLVVACGIGVVLRKSRPDPYQEVAYLQAVSAELQAGRSLRQALIDASVRAPDLDLTRVVRLCRSGRPMTEVATVTAGALPGTGRLVGAAVRIAAESGGRVSTAFATLAGIQADRIELRREVRSAGSSARASVFVLAGLPVFGLLFAGASGMLAELMAMGRVGPILVAIGSALLIGGATVTLLIGRKLS